VSIDSQEVQPLKNSIQPIYVRISSKEQLGAGDETASKCSLPSRSSETSNLSLRRRCSPCESITEALANIRRDLVSAAIRSKFMPTLFRVIDAQERA